MRRVFGRPVLHNPKIMATFAPEIIKTDIMRVVNLGATDSVINTYMAQLRDAEVQKNRLQFRQNLTRIAHAMAYEISRTMRYVPQTVRTPLAEAEVRMLEDHVVVGTVLRAGLAFHQGFLDVFDNADSAFVAAYREEGNKDDIQIHMSQIVYDYVCLSLPLQRVHPEGECNPDTVRFLGQEERKDEEAAPPTTTKRRRKV